MACKIPLAEPKEKHYFQSYLVEGDVYFPIYVSVSVSEKMAQLSSLVVILVLQNSLLLYRVGDH